MTITDAYTKLCEYLRGNTNIKGIFINSDKKGFTVFRTSGTTPNGVFQGYPIYYKLQAERDFDS